MRLVEFSLGMQRNYKLFLSWLIYGLPLHCQFNRYREISRLISGCLFLTLLFEFSFVVGEKWLEGDLKNKNRNGDDYKRGKDVIKRLPGVINYSAYKFASL